LWLARQVQKRKSNEFLQKARYVCLLTVLFQENLMRSTYSGWQIAIHWLVFLLVVTAYCAMEFRGFAPRSYRPYFNIVHVSCGISILVLMVTRLLLRLKTPSPAIVPKPKAMLTGMAHLGHLVIYLLFIALPVIGLLMMWFRGNNWIAFGIVMPHAAEADFDLVDLER